MIYWDIKDIKNSKQIFRVENKKIRLIYGSQSKVLGMVIKN